MNNELYNCTEAAAILRIHEQTLYRWAQRGWFPTIRVGPKILRFYRIDVVSFQKKLIEIEGFYGGPVAKQFSFPSRLS